MKSKILWLIVLFLAVYKFFLLVHVNLPPDTEEIQTQYFTYSLTRVDSTNFINLLRFGIKEGYVLFWFSTFVITVINIVFPLSIVVIKCIGFMFLIFSAFLLSKIIKHVLDVKEYLPLVYLLFLISPWQNWIVNFNFSLVLTIFLACLIVYWEISKSNKVFVAGILLAFTSWAGLIFAALFINMSGVISRKSKILFIVLIFFMIILNRNYTIKTYKNSFLYSLKPSNVALEINSRQKGTHQILRKILDNKIIVINQKISRHLTSILDFEQFASSQNSYDLIKQSGLSPKNPALGLVWEIPIILSGGLIVLKQKKLFIKILILASFSVFTFFVFKKEDFPESAVLLSPIFIFLEFVTITKLLRKRKYIGWIAISLLIISFAFYQNGFYLKPSAYRYSRPVFYKEIANWIIESDKDYKKIVATNRFGPMSLAYVYYQKIDPNLFWQQYPKSSEIKFENVEFEDFTTYKSSKEVGVIYIGFAGDFVGTGKELEKKSLPNGFVKLKNIDGEEELVFDYGNNIWIGYFEH